MMSLNYANCQSGQPVYTDWQQPTTQTLNYVEWQQPYHSDTAQQHDFQQPQPPYVGPESYRHPWTNQFGYHPCQPPPNQPPDPGPLYWQYGYSEYDHQPPLVQNQYAHDTSIAPHSGWYQQPHHSHPNIDEHTLDPYYRLEAYQQRADDQLPAQPPHTDFNLSEPLPHPAMEPLGMPRDPVTPNLEPNLPLAVLVSQLERLTANVEQLVSRMDSNELRLGDPHVAMRPPPAPPCSVYKPLCSASHYSAAPYTVQPRINPDIAGSLQQPPTQRSPPCSHDIRYGSIESLADDIDAHESVQSLQIHYDDILSDQLLNRDPVGDDEVLLEVEEFMQVANDKQFHLDLSNTVAQAKDVIHSSVEGSFTLGDVEASMELVVKEVDSGFGRNGSDTKWKYADNIDEHRTVGINLCSTTLDTDARLTPLRIDTKCLGIPGCVDRLHFWAPDNHKAEECLWNKTVCKDHEPNLVESQDGSVEVSGVTDVEVSESKDDGQDFFGYTEDVVTEGAADDTFIKMGSEKDNNEFIENDIDSPQNDTYGNKEISVGQVASGDADSGKSYERIGCYGGPRGFFRGGFSNGDGEGDRPRRPLDRRSRIRCDYESKREGCHDHNSLVLVSVAISRLNKISTIMGQQKKG